tara:strand:+ start:3382 stop:3900 length:519 start_codon:yes stop_codon:yes gene_type:complete
MDKTLMIIVGITSLLVLYAVYVMFEVRIRNDEYGIDLIGGKRGDHTVELFESRPASLNHSMGAYSNIKFMLPNNDHMHRMNAPLLSSKLYVPAGTPLPLMPKVSKEPLYSNGPNVDGTPYTPKAMSMLKYNQSKPECCPSTFSTSTGCVCLNKKQSDFINSRGNNRTAPSNF